MCVCSPSLRTPYCSNCAPLVRKQAIEAYQKQVAIGQDVNMLNRAKDWAGTESGCDKVKVGAVLVDIHQRIVYGANRVIPNGCGGVEACQVDGHCVSTIHAEIDAIVGSKRDLYGATIYVTRYPCEACARAIVTAGIKTVVYGRENQISKETQGIFTSAGIVIRHLPSYGGD